MIGRTRCNDCIFPETESILDKAHNEHIPRCVYGRRQAEEGISEKGWHDAHKIQNKTVCFCSADLFLVITQDYPLSVGSSGSLIVGISF